MALLSRVTRLLSFFIFICFSGHSQTITKLKEFKVKGSSRLTADRLGNFFLTFKNGSIKKYDLNGKLIASLKSKLGEPTLIEPWFHPSIFVYYRKSRQYIVFDREFKNSQIRSLDPAVAVDPYLVCPTNDNRLLVFDKADHSIKKIDRFNNAQIFEFSIETSKVSDQSDFIFMREYQNMIFLLDKVYGIYIYNSIGKLINRVEVLGVESLGFYGEELFYLSNNKVILMDLYTEKTREIPVENTFRQSCITDERLIGLDNRSKVEIYQLVDSAHD